MNRILMGHIVNLANDKLKIEVIDEPGQGGANHVYRIGLDDGTTLAQIKFQNGPILETGVNGLTHEALLEIVADRLRAFQDGSFKCKENACALTHIEEAQHWLQQRTLARMRRGVEGTHTI